VDDAHSHYYEGIYWNSFPEGRRQINARATGDPETSIYDAFEDAAGGRVFDRALILNAGNGWVERNLFGRGMIRRSIGVDWSKDLVVEAEREASAAGYAAEYVAADINTFVPDPPIDLIVNYAAGHHIRDLDRVLRACRTVLDPDGLFLCWDYVGPHRNQYPWSIWDAAWQANRQLPEHLRTPLHYPHLPTMRAVDPSEAIHSELFMEVFARYFDVTELRRVGGAIAYLTLFGNRALLDVPPDAQDLHVRRMFELDAEFLAANPHHNLFVFMVATPREGALDDEASLRRWTAEEEQREKAAESSGGEYYPLTALQDMTRRWADDRVVAEHRLASIHELHRELEDAKRKPPALNQRVGAQAHRQISRLGRTRLGRAVRRGVAATR
jgi:SAM-dependent methyltransferase